MVVFQEVHPFFYRGFRNLVELIHPNEEIFRENLCRQTCPYHILVTLADNKFVVGVNANKRGSSVVEIVAAFAKVEIKYVLLNKSFARPLISNLRKCVP